MLYQSFSIKFSTDGYRSQKYNTTVVVPLDEREWKS